MDDLHAACDRRIERLEAALREAEAVLAQTFKVLLTVKGTLDHPYPDAPTLTPWTRWCEPVARRAYDTRRLARAALGDQEAPTEPTMGGRIDPMPDPYKAAPQVAPEPESDYDRGGFIPDEVWTGTGDNVRRGERR